jgi:hypothetical protein
MSETAVTIGKAALLVVSGIAADRIYLGVKGWLRNRRAANASA